MYLEKGGVWSVLFEMSWREELSEADKERLGEGGWEEKLFQAEEGNAQRP
jgi:hypothetical protein